MGATDESGNASVYVIDDEYRLVYFNHLLKAKYPQVQEGDYCYERLCGETRPCHTCPLVRENCGESVFYNKLLEGWVNVETGSLTWPGKGECRIILAAPVREGDALYEDLNRISTYNELKSLMQLKRSENQDKGMDKLLDPLTGLYRRRVFFQMAESFLDDAVGQYCLAAIDIEHFKIFNDWYGQGAGDKLLVDIGAKLHQLEQEKKGIAGYIGGDDFAILMPDDADEIKRLQSCIAEYVKAYGDNAGFSPTLGIYEIEEREYSVSAMYDRAVIAMSSIKGNYAQRICYYDKRMKQRMEEEHLLLSEVQKGMDNGEFVFYTQPKCDLSTGKIVGIEALVRWNHPVRGVIAPGMFLPLLESNGLITNLDMYIWESVCKAVKNWIDQGNRPIPISVNVSCVDIFAIDVVKTFRELVERYGIEPRLIEIEITESAYVERFEAVIAIAEELQAAGFTVLMDDFGSGYSSLNMLKDVSVDILKIDMKFLDLNENSLGRGVSILEAIVKMAHVMGLKMIAEGVETKEQVEFLLNIGCSYGQGYYFYHPMPPEEMEQMVLRDKNLDYRGITLRQITPVRMRDLLDEDVISNVMAGNILGAAAFYDMHGDSLELLRANEKYGIVTHTSMVNLEEQRRDILSEIYIEDREVFRNIFRRAKGNQLKGAEGIVRRRTDERTYLWMKYRVFYLREQDGVQIYYASLTDVSGQKQKERDLVMAGRKMESILRQADINGWDWDFAQDTVSISGSAVLFPSFSRRWQCGGSERMIIENFSQEMLSGELIPGEYGPAVQEFLEAVKSCPSGHSIQCESPIEIGQGRRVWLMAACETLRDENDVPVRAVGYYRNISREHRRVQHLTQMAETDAMTGLFNRQAAIPRIEKYIQNIGDGYAALIMFDLDNFKQANDVFGHSFGDTVIIENARKLKQYFRNDDIICRIGGDEFMVLCKNIRERDLVRKLTKVVEAMTMTYEKDGQSVKFSASAGYVMIPEQGTEFDDLYGKTDVALFAAKLQGKCSFCKYDFHMKTVRHELAGRENGERV